MVQAHGFRACEQGTDLEVHGLLLVIERNELHLLERGGGLEGCWQSRLLTLLFEVRGGVELRRKS